MSEWETPLRILAIRSLSTEEGQEADARCGVEAVAEPKAQTGALQTCKAPFLPAPTLLRASLSSLLTRTVFIS